MDRSGGVLKNKAVSVVVRVRPTLKFESSESCVDIPEHQETPQTLVIPQDATVDGRKKSYTFDYIFDDASTQEEVFGGIGGPVIESCLEGFHCTVFCYGQTGAGKTFTMTGPEGKHKREEDGLIPRMLYHLYGRVRQMFKESDGTTQTKIRCSFLEIYKEKLYDLLLPPPKHPMDKPRSLSLRENLKKGMFVENLTTKPCTNAKEALSLLRAGVDRRRMGSTKMNEKSSRSHSVFTVEMEIKTKGTITSIKKSKLHLIDLAGSERQQYTKSTGLRLKEACSINQSLSCLGKVILSLAEQSRIRNNAGKKSSKKTTIRKIHVHYRDSKLTHLLKNSLGGNSRTVMVANISPSFTQYAETQSTLLFAKRTKRIKNKPVANEDIKGNTEVLEKQVAILRAQVDYLKTAMNKMRKDRETLSMSSTERPSNIFQLPSSSTSSSSEEESADAKNIRLEKVLARSFEKCQHLRERNRNYQAKLETLLSVIAGKEKQFITARMALKLSESLQGREYSRFKRFQRENGVQDVKVNDARKLDFEFVKISDQEMTKKMIGREDFGMKDEDEDEEENEGEDDEDNNPKIILDRIERVFEKIFHPEDHPTVRELAFRNIELTEHLQKVMEHAKGEDYLTYLDKLQQTTEADVETLLRRKQRLEREVGTLDEISEKKTDYESKQTLHEREYEILTQEVKEECDTKIDRVTRESLGLREENEELKCLVTELFELSTPDVVAEVKRKHEVIVDRLTGEFEEKMKNMEEEKDRVVGHLNIAKSEVKKVKNELKEKELVTSIEDSVSVGMIGRLKARNGELRGKLRSAEDMAKEMYVKKARLDDRVKELEKEVSEYRLKISIQQEDDNEEQMRIFSKEKSRLTKEIGRLESEIEKEKLEKSKQKDEMMLKIRKDHQKLKKMKIEYNKMKEKVNPLENELEEVSRERDILQGKLEVSKINCSRLHDDIKDVKRRASESDTRVSQYRIKIRQYQLEIKKLKEKVTQQQQQREDLLQSSSSSSSRKKSVGKLTRRWSSSNNLVSNNKENGNGNNTNGVGGSMKHLMEQNNPWKKTKKLKKKKKKKDLTMHPLFMPSPPPPKKE